MTPTRTAAIAAALALTAACAAEDAAQPNGPDAAAGAADAEGRCWATEPVPAIYEQVPGQVQVVQAEIAEDGTVLRPPIYRNTSVPKIVRPRGEMRFEVPCRADMAPDFAASVQRALKVRGKYGGPVTGRFDAATTAAIRRYQSERGLESGTLSLETARSLGLAPVALPGTE
ncbi:peptidoglycan-binding domain-containing protein [Roseivivax isoporae]|uniref:Peptidoglycan binding-like domain-containing protein n=1 Tax=Roseivivax isoporae LMG 25204 TaxID=1449351 RepID=X7F625_9RHOB|nr:peptidoglycan-binding domain-containing protein [Roseivivax isoporae]ETX28265.1 hypothetical protein RISW2_09140 [Roseivivax isoporae LMG 25204]